MLDKLWRQRLERARYAAGRAHRQYQLAEPETRLVVRQLEKEWEAALAETDRLRTDYQRFTESLPMTLTERQAMGNWLRICRRSGTPRPLARRTARNSCAPSSRRSPSRSWGNSELVEVTIIWAGGHRTTGRAIRPVARVDQLSHYPRLLARVTQLAEQGKSTRQIAEALRPPKRTSRFEPAQVRTLLNQHRIIAPR